MKNIIKYIIAILLFILIITILYMAFTTNTLGNYVTNSTIVEGFSFVDKPKPTKLGEKRRENFLANEVKNFAFDNHKEHLANTPLSKLKSKRSSNKSKYNKGSKGNKGKLAKLAKKGKVDEFQDVLNEVDTMDVSKISVTGISDTIRRYNENIENRLKYAKSKNNSSDLESAMAQFDVLKDEFVKIFAFSDYI